MADDLSSLFGALANLGSANIQSQGQDQAATITGNDAIQQANIQTQGQEETARITGNDAIKQTQMTTNEQYAALGVQQQQQNFDNSMMSSMMPMFQSMFGGLCGNLSPQMNNTMQGHVNNLNSAGYTPGNVSECLDNMNNSADDQAKPHVKQFSDKVKDKMKTTTQDYNSQGQITSVTTQVHKQVNTQTENKS